MQADQTVEVLYESEADYPGISGMWSLTPWPGADSHSLVVLSFASNSRAMATGNQLCPLSITAACINLSITFRVLRAIWGQQTINP